MHWYCPLVVCSGIVLWICSLVIWYSAFGVEHVAGALVLCPLARRLSACPSYWASYPLSVKAPSSLPLSCHKIISQSFCLQSYQLSYLRQIMELPWYDCFKLVALVNQLGRDAEPLLMPTHCHCPMPRPLCYLHYLHCLTLQYHESLHNTSQ